jgi:two-component system sensor histidine kinase HydH
MTISMQLRDRARFDALRRKMFNEMGQAARRWGPIWLALFSAIVLIGLVARGASPARIGLQATALAIALPSLVQSVRHPSCSKHQPTLLAGMLLYLACIANTGGIASPFIIVGIPMLFAAALFPMRREVRMLLFGAFIFGIVAMSLAAGRAFGELPSPRPSAWQWPPAVYVSLATVTAIFVVVKVHQIGKNVSLLYERVALELAASREELCDESEDRTRALEGVAARFAHEVKNPLAAIKGLSTHMARTATDPKMAERLAIVAQEADRLKEIMDGFLSFSRGLDEMQVASMRPFELARELAVLLEIRAAETGVALEVSGNADLQLNADRRKLRQALLNLVLNAVQASPSGQTVSIDVKRACSGGATIQVIDRGGGMSGDILERIRRPYYTTREGGTGLGVAVARGLVEQHGGELRYESTPGRGTTVTIELPSCARAIADERRLPDPARDPAPRFHAPEGHTT